MPNCDGNRYHPLSLFPLGLATLTAYVDPDDKLTDEHVERLGRFHTFG